MEIAQDPKSLEAGWARLACEAMPSIAWATDATLRVTTCRAAVPGLEVQPDAMVGRLVGDLADETGRAAHLRALAGEPGAYRAEWLGHVFEARVAPLWHEGAVIGVQGLALDLTALGLLAPRRPAPGEGLQDGLTGLPNRTALLGEVEAALHGLPGRSALVLVDLDGFAHLNETLGHQKGDEVLRVAAGRLGRTLRASDVLARYGGDEFAVLLRDVAGAEGARVAAERLLEALAPPLALVGKPVRVSGSAGVVMLAEAGTEPATAAEAIARAAEGAVLQAKARGRGRACLADARHGEAPLARLEAELRRALERDDFRTRYEPTVSVKSGRVTGFEILLWRRGTPAAGVPRLS